MQNSELSLEPHSRSKKLIYAFVAISFLGLLDATYLTVEHYSGANLNCYIFSGCDKVLTSEYSVILGIPMAMYGAAFYFSVLLSALLYLDTKKTIFLKILPVLGTWGFLFSLLLIYLQAFVIKAFCTYCLFSALTSTLLFVCGLILLKGRKLFRK